MSIRRQDWLAFNDKLVESFIIFVWEENVLSHGCRHNPENLTRQKHIPTTIRKHDVPWILWSIGSCPSHCHDPFLAPHITSDCRKQARLRGRNSGQCHFHHSKHTLPAPTRPSTPKSSPFLMEILISSRVDCTASLFQVKSPPLIDST